MSLEKGVVSPILPVPANIKKPEYVGKKKPSNEPWCGSEIRTQNEIDKIKVASEIAKNCLDFLEQKIVPGITTNEIDILAHNFIISNNAYPSTLGYCGYPKSICTSINEVVCHGIPDSTILYEGDIVNVDVTVFFNGYHGDTNRTYFVGEKTKINSKIINLVNVTKDAMNKGIDAVKPGRPINIIGKVISSYAKRYNYGVVEGYTGHSIGQAFHGSIIIPHFDSAPDFATTIEAGMVFTIEPMLNLGTKRTKLWNDGWTVVTADSKPSAQFEHTIVVTDYGAEILT